ncbi:hypothetical protein WJ96_20235 [Burkholderia ubonensis]|uniref:Fimbrial-type adhesion domain-containing protein n=1 Tax=Burkholderia ubonensis TaxID=101571 RepID=A0AAW3MQF2_9BURK|nr:fimbrial protein [Burkholderia ubonensis]KVP89330.1 hypothetical protein WJ96_20235 [Burkholderia ubonensis]
MKEKAISFVAAASLGLVVAPAAFAADEQQGRVTFNGELTADTCTIDATSLDQTVQLPKVSTNKLAAKGDAYGSKPFDIKVTNCPATVKKIAAHFEVVNMHPETRTLTNLEPEATAAKNVTVQLLNADGSVVKVGDEGKYFDVSDSTHDATMTYAGQYYALGATTAGKVTTFTRFTLAYQ